MESRFDRQYNITRSALAAIRHIPMWLPPAIIGLRRLPSCSASMKNNAVTPAAKTKNIANTKPSQSKRSIPPNTWWVGRRANARLTARIMNIRLP